MDGEGVTREDGTHDYVLFSCGEESLVNPDGSRLEWHQVFAFLYGEFEKRPDAAYVGFFLGYDFTQWLRTLSENRARMLFDKEGIAARKRTGSGGNPIPFPVLARDPSGREWQFDILGAKRFKLRPADASRWMFVCDTGPFWQTSFVKAVDPKSWETAPVCTPEEYATIVEGKARRSTAGFDDDMIRYNLTENRVLSRLTARLNEGFTAAGLRLRRDQWMGPGQAAQAWLKLIEAPTAVEIRDTVPRWALDAAQHSYFGGWFEIMAHGHVPGETYEYDINSAYPAVIASLPCLLHGVWTKGTGAPPVGRSRYTLLLCEMWGSDRRSGVHPHRVPSGRILRPAFSRGWAWAHELDAAKEAGLIDGVNPLEWATYEPCDCPPPMRAIADLYQRRLEIGKNSVEGKALKLVYNSAYGKFAQSIGSPKYANPVYASLITAGCRTQILRAIATHPDRSDGVVMVATDGVYFRSVHPALDIDANRLGAWDSTVKSNLTLFMPGVYWADKDRERIAAGQDPSLKSRGIRASDLAKRVHEIDDAFTLFEDWPTMTLGVSFAMTSCKQALARGKWDTAGDIATDGTRTISSRPVGKRGLDVQLEGDLWRTPVMRLPAELEESVPYDRTFGMPPDFDPLGGDSGPVTPDGASPIGLDFWALLS